MHAVGHFPLPCGVKASAIGLVDVPYKKPQNGAYVNSVLSNPLFQQHTETCFPCANLKHEIISKRDGPKIAYQPMRGEECET